MSHAVHHYLVVNFLNWYHGAWARRHLKKIGTTKRPASIFQMSMNLSTESYFRESLWNLAVRRKLPSFDVCYVMVCKLWFQPRSSLQIQSHFGLGSSKTDCSTLFSLLWQNCAPYPISIFGGWKCKTRTTDVGNLKETQRPWQRFSRSGGMNSNGLMGQ